MRARCTWTYITSFYNNNNNNNNTINNINMSEGASPLLNGGRSYQLSDSKVRNFLDISCCYPPPPFTHTVFGDLIFYFFHNLWGAFIFSFPWGDLIFWGTCHFMFQFCVSQSYYLNPTWISCRCPTSYLRQRNYNHMWIVLLATWRRGQPTPTSCLHLKWNQHFCRNWKPTWAGSSMP